MSKRIVDFRKGERTAATKDGRQTWNYGNWATLMKVGGPSPNPTPALARTLPYPSPSPNPTLP